MASLFAGWRAVPCDPAPYYSMMEPWLSFLWTKAEQRSICYYSAALTSPPRPLCGHSLSMNGEGATVSIVTSHVHRKDFPLVIKQNEKGSKGQWTLAGSGAEPRVSSNVKIDGIRCKSCGLCVRACRRGCIEISESYNRAGYRYAVVARPDDCVVCGACARTCPEPQCITVQEPKS